MFDYQWKLITPIIDSFPSYKPPFIGYDMFHCNVWLPKGLQMSLCTIDRGRLHQQHLLLEGQEVREGDQQLQNRTILGWVEAFEPWEMEKWVVLSHKT